MTELFKLSEASKLCGVSVGTLRLLISDELLPAATRTSNGHPLLPADAVPTWQQCRDLIEKQRATALQRAADHIKRIEVEIQAVGNDIAEAQEHPLQPLGVDLLAANSRAAHGSETTLSAALSQLDFARIEISIYDRALKELVNRERF
ncbi:MerR family DNA-binding transcriptional regulator [Mycolicibacterium senegalense]|uniref:MerR family DNA-binding transcriptional regulator n=1 Tax=Mycobacteriaceae TaxID=1762 RepID=UPI003AACC01C